MNGQSAAADVNALNLDSTSLDPSWIRKMARARVAVLGDLMLDRFIWGRVARISPEAPVPIVEVDRRRGRDGNRLGGAANVAHNVVSLGGRATLFGVLGDDEEGRNMWRMLASRGIDGRGIVTIPDRPTTVKTRVIAHNQQVVRIDLEDDSPVNTGMLERLYGALTDQISDFDVVIVSDYAKGVVDAALLTRLIREAAERGGGTKAPPILVDPRVANLDAYVGATLVTPNRAEAYEGMGWRSHEGDAEAAADGWLQRLKCDAVLVTLGEEGMFLKKRGGRAIRVTSEAADVYDVTGAGDTVIATMAAALAVGASMEEAMILANMAAGVVVGRVGTAAVTPSELAAMMERCRTKAI